MIEIGIGERYAGNRRMAHALSRMQFGRAFDLRAKVRRCAQQEPQAALLGERNLRLRARLAMECACPHLSAIPAGAIPLRESASRRRPKNLYQHLCEFTASECS